MLLEDIFYEINLNQTEFQSEKILKIIKNYNNEDWKNYISLFESNSTCKIKIFEDELFDVYIIKWDLNKISNIHNHAKNGCYLKLLQGKLQEQIFNNHLSLIKTSTINENDISYIQDTLGFHKIINISDIISYSLHFYSPPNHNTQYFN
jgi:hypothetical protein